MLDPAKLSCGRGTYLYVHTITKRLVFIMDGDGQLSPALISTTYTAYNVDPPGDLGRRLHSHTTRELRSFLVI